MVEGGVGHCGGCELQKHNSCLGKEREMQNNWIYWEIILL